MDKTDLCRLKHRLPHVPKKSNTNTAGLSRVVGDNYIRFLVAVEIGHSNGPWDFGCQEPDFLKFARRTLPFTAAIKRRARVGEPTESANGVQRLLREVWQIEIANHPKIHLRLSVVREAHGAQPSRCSSSGNPESFSGIRRNSALSLARPVTTLGPPS